MFPVRCYSCNAALAHLSARYKKQVREPGGSPAMALDGMNVSRTCCRRMFLGHVDLLPELIEFPNKDTVLDGGGTVLQREVRFTRTVACD